MRITGETYVTLYRRVHGKDPPGYRQAIAAKPHKYHAKKVTLDGHRFMSTGEAKAYTDLRWRFLAGEISEPLLQVSFSLGRHYGKDRTYVSDFAWVELRTGCLVVADFKGFETLLYRDKKRVFEALYGMPITELRGR